MTSPLDGSTSAPALHPDLGPGAGQGRDAALDAAAREGMAAPLPDYEAPPDLVGVDEAIEVGRAQMAAERQQRARMMTAPSLPAVSLRCKGTPGAPGLVAVMGGYQECSGCVDCQESER